jgi:hypothetical protein
MSLLPFSPRAFFMIITPAHMHFRYRRQLTKGSRLLVAFEANKIPRLH